MNKQLLHRQAGALALALAALPALAEPAGETPTPNPLDPRRGAYALVAVGTAKTTVRPGFVSCICESDNASAGKLALGWRFGVSALELGVIDFGQTRFGTHPVITPGASEHVRLVSLSGAWRARFGSRVEATWRAGAAHVSVATEGWPTANQWRPIWGASIGWRFDESLALELGFDMLMLAHDSTGTDLSASFAPALGLRWRF